MMAGVNIKPSAGNGDFRHNKALGHLPGQGLIFIPDPLGAIKTNTKICKIIGLYPL